MYHLLYGAGGRFCFSRNWLTQRADVFWALTREVSADVRRRGYAVLSVPVLGPLFDPAFAQQEALLELAELIKRFQLFPDKDNAPEWTGRLMLRSRGGVVLRLVPRSSIKS